MRKLFVLAAAGLGLCACAASEVVQRQAAVNCQLVGITEKDPQFATCTKAFSRAQIENSLAQNYRNALNPAPDDRRIRHQWVY